MGGVGDMSKNVGRESGEVTTARLSPADWQTTNTGVKKLPKESHIPNTGVKKLPEESHIPNNHI